MDAAGADDHLLRTDGRDSAWPASQRRLAVPGIHDVPRRPATVSKGGLHPRALRYAAAEPEASSGRQWVEVVCRDARYCRKESQALGRCVPPTLPLMRIIPICVYIRPGQA